MIAIDQSPIGRTPRSNPATYTNVFDPIRNLMATTPEARMRGYGPGRFSFNVKGGRCEACDGDGQIKIEMHFLPDIYVDLRGLRRQALRPRDAGGALQGAATSPRSSTCSVEQAREVFRNMPAIERILATLDEVGLGYIRLGQPATTLSGGEAQRVKLATRAVQALDRPHALPARRAHHRPPLRRRAASCSSCSTGWSTWATPWSSSSTTSTSSRPPTG